jgi:1,4-dihydroxy-2-naphthoyl-CoA hydrolase
MNVAGTVEFTITEMTPERVVGEMPVQAGIRDPFGVAYAGGLLWFADVCATVLACGKAHPAPGGAAFPLGISPSANLTGNQKDDVFKVTAVFLKRGRQLTSCAPPSPAKADGSSLTSPLAMSRRDQPPESENDTPAAAASLSEYIY